MCPQHSSLPTKAGRCSCWLAGLPYKYERKRVCVIIGLHKPVFVFWGKKENEERRIYKKRAHPFKFAHRPDGRERRRLRGGYVEAWWLEEMRMKNHAEILSRVFLALFGQRQSL